MPPKKRTLLELFLSHITIENGHWLWTGCLDKDGYGVFHDNTKKRPAHVVAYKLYKADFNSSLNVLHKCDIRRCVNPNCLFQGTQSDNIKDCVQKGRHAEIRRTHCDKGHLYTEETTRIYVRKNGKKERRCKICCSPRGYLVRKDLKI